MILIFKGKPLYFIEETEGFSISKDSIHLSLVIVYSHYALGISNYPDIVSTVFSLYKNRFLMELILIFRHKPWYFIDETGCFSMLNASIPLLLVTVYSRYALGISDYPYIVSTVFSL